MPRILMALGVLLIFIGIIWAILEKSNWHRLPGDLEFHLSTVTVHLPIVTCILVSAILSLLIWFLKK